MSAPEHHHQLIDANGHYPAASTTLTGYRIVMATPIHCASCDADHDALINDLREHGGHVVDEADGNLTAEVTT